jgi:molybdopterin synthase sulfur carrier subunit
MEHKGRGRADVAVHLGCATVVSTPASPPGDAGDGGGKDLPARPPTVTLRLFAAAREAAGVGRLEVRGATVGEVLAQASGRFGPTFARVAECCALWVNGEPATAADRLAPGDEVAVLPPVSGGAR